MKVKHPRKPRTRTRVISVQVDADYAEALFRLANVNGLHVSQVVRKMLTGEMPPVKGR